MLNLKQLAPIVIFAGIGGTLFAQGNLIERIKDQAQISKGKKWLKRDRVESEEFKALVAKLEVARNSSDDTLVQVTRGEISGAMKRELDQSMEKLEQAKKEALASSFEVIGQRIELEVDKKRADDGRDHAKIDSILDALALADDKRDRNDDIEDAKAIGGRAKRQGEILAEFSSPDGPEPAAADGLLRKFQEILEADIRATEAEIKEDQKELAEDRRKAARNRRKKKR